MIVEIRERRVNLCQRKVRKLFMDRIGAPPIGKMIERNFDDLDLRVIYLGDTIFVADYMGKWLADWHNAR